MTSEISGPTGTGFDKTEHDAHVTSSDSKPFAKKILEDFIFNIKWVLVLFYVGLIGVLLLYGYTFAKELVLVFKNQPESTEQMKIVVLDMVDIVMIANLIKMIITGSYNSFISKDHGRLNERISSGMLKIKIMTSVIIVSTIGLLKSFVADSVSWDVVNKQIYIYGIFLVGALVLGILEYLHIKGEQLEDHH